MDETVKSDPIYTDKDSFGPNERLQLSRVEQHKLTRHFAASDVFARCLIALACTTSFISPCMAADAPALQAPVPEEVQALVPAGMKLIYFRADNGRTEGSDAVAILDHTNKPADPNMSTGPRPLIMLRKTGGVYKEEARNDHVIACSSCGEDMDDPFTPGGIELTPNHLVIEQDHGSASSAVYKFVRDPKSEQWIVTSAVNTLAKQSLTGGGFNKTPTRLKLPTPPLLTNFDPGWRTPQFWKAVVVNDKTHDFSFVGNQSDEKALDESVKDECQKSGICHVLVKQLNGCVALVKDQSGSFYGGSSSAKGNAEKEAKTNALNECKSRGAGSCEAVRSDCSQNSE